MPGHIDEYIRPHLMTRLKFKSVTYRFLIHYNTLRAMNNNGITLLDVVITRDTTPSSSHPLSQQLLRPKQCLKHEQVPVGVVT